MNDLIDPIIENFLSITRRYKVLIVSTTAVATIAALSVGVLLRADYEGTSIVSVARIEPDGPIVDLYTIDEQLESQVARLVVGSQLSDATRLESVVFRDQPPSSKRLPLVALRVSSPDAVSVRRATDRALSYLSSLEGPIFDAEKTRLEQGVRDLEVEVHRLSAGAITPKTQDALQKAIFDRAEAKRRLSPIRTHPSHVMAMMPVKLLSRRTRTAAFTMLGLVCGMGAGYSAAFLLAARSILERSRRAV